MDELKVIRQKGQQMVKPEIIPGKTDEPAAAPPEPLAAAPVLFRGRVLGKEIEVTAPLRALVVDSDSALQKLIENYMRDLGTRKLDMVSDGKLGWLALSDANYDFVVMDWRLREVSGLSLYNRIRSSQHTKHTPVVVLSGFVHKEDFRILGESQFTSFVRKPLTVTEFDGVLRQTMRQAKTYTSIDESIRAMLEKIIDDSKKVIALFEKILKQIHQPVVYISVAGQYLLEKGKLELAERAMKIVLGLDPKNVTAMSELSKIFHLSGRSKEAAALLEKANHFSPENIERLCLMGEIGLNLQETDKARAYFKDALSIDAESVKANAGLLLTENLSEHIEQHNQSKPLQMQFAGVLNAVGITHVKNQQIDRGIAQYKAALCFIHDNATLSKLHFNLGLAYLRKEDISEANSWFKSADKIAAPDFTKPAQYVAMTNAKLGTKKVEESGFII